MIAGAPTGSGVTVSQAGNRPAPLTLKIKGGLCIEPQIVRKSDGARIALEGPNLQATDVLEINVTERTVKLNGVNAYSRINSASTNWGAFSAPPSPASEEYFLVCRYASGVELEVLSRAAYA